MVCVVDGFVFGECGGGGDGLLLLIIMFDGMMYYVSFMFFDGFFELKWVYNGIIGMLYFKMKCMNIGWCGVGFSILGNGVGMKDYDIVVGGFGIFDYFYVSLCSVLLVF